MICDDCAWEADAVKTGKFTPRRIAAAVKKVTAIGHAACTGCTCQCRPVPKERRVVNRDDTADNR